MPLQIRRGTAAALSSITPAQGEPLYTTDTKQLFFGDGSTAGGLAHTHAIADVTNLQTTLNGKAASVHTHAAGDITSGVLGTARLGTGTADNTTFLRGDGTWAVPAGGGGGSDGTVPLITQSYTSTEGFGLGGWSTYTRNGGFVRSPSLVNRTYGANATKSGYLELGVTNTSQCLAMLGGHGSTLNQSSVFSTTLASNKITGVIRLPAIPTSSEYFQAAVGFNSRQDILWDDGGEFGPGSLDYGVYFWCAAGTGTIYWQVMYRGWGTGPAQDYANFKNIVTDVPVTTAWTKFEIATAASGGDVTYTCKINDVVKSSLSNSTLAAGPHYVDMTIQSLHSPMAAIQYQGNTQTRYMMVDHLSLLSTVTR